MSTVVFDIETNAVSNFSTLLGLEVIHCIALSVDGEDPRLVDVPEALEILAEAETIVGHNIQGFDVRAIQRLNPEWQHKGKIRDTLIMARMLWPDIQNDDWTRPDFPRNMAGRQSLKAWGYRLGMNKDEFGETTDWAEYTDEMGEYCVQDVRVTLALWDKIKEEGFEDRPTVLEHAFAEIVSQQERNGFAFDVEAARDLHGELLQHKRRLLEELKGAFPPQIIEMKSPAYYIDPATGDRYTRKKDAPTSVIKSRLLRGEVRTKEIPFEPNSRLQIANGLIAKYGWSPKEFTPEGRPKVDEAVLSGLDYPEAKTLVKYLTVGKRLGQIADGKEAWIRVETDGRIHGRVNPCGAVTSRCTHSKPNIAQVPRVGAFFGKECRSLFVAPEGYSLVGVDASGLELRCLAHYTYPFDKGKYAKEILEGDIHTANQEAAGLDNRDQSKVFIYALCYGAGDVKIGSIVGGGRVEGRRLKRQFFAKMPALKRLKDGIAHRLKTQDYLTGIDGRRLRIRSPHSALNTLLQSAGAIAMKAATVNLHDKLNLHFPDSDGDILQVAHIHDEIQLQVRTEIAEDVGRLSVQAIREAGESLGFRCPLDGEYKIGRNWAETH